MTDDAMAVPEGAGRALGERARESVDTPIEEFVDVGVISWFEPYGREVAAIRSALSGAVRSAWNDTADGVLAERPDARDAVRPAGWRMALRFFGILSAATSVAGVFASLGFSRGSNPPFPAASAAVLAGIAGVVAVVSIGGSLLFPSRMGRPNRLVHGVVWMAAIGSLGSALVLPLRSETWAPATPPWWALTTGAGLVLLVLAVVMSVWRRRGSGASPIDDADVSRMRVSVVQEQLDRSVAEVERAWQRLPPTVRDAMTRERDVALDIVAHRLPSALDGAWVRSHVPGTMMLPHAADLAHRVLHLGSAQLVDREAGGRHGYFVERSRRRL